MKFSCLKSELVQALQIAGRASAVKPQTPILSGIYLNADEGSLKVQATDYEISVIISVNAEIESPGDIVVSSRYLQEVARSLPEEKVSFEYDAASKICKISSGKSTFTLLSMSSDEFPKIRRVNGKQCFNIKDTALRELIRKTIFSCASDESSPVFTGALFEIEENVVRMVATNTHRLSLDEDTIDEPQKGKHSYIVPKRILDELQHIMTSEIPSDVQVNCTDSEMSFELGNIYFTTRLIEGRFPDYHKVIPSSFPTRITLKTEEFLAAVSRVALIARSSDYNTIKLAFSMGQVHISSNNPIIGQAEEIVPAVIDGEDITIAFNSKYITDVLKNLRGDEFYFSVIAPLKPAAVREMGNEEFIYIVVPIRTKG